MENRISQRIIGHRLPEYMLEVLTGGYAKAFLPVGIIRKEDSYTFNYDLNGYRRCKADRLPTKEKFRLLEILYDMNEDNENHLIPGDRYLLEPGLIYWNRHQIQMNTVRIIFYPDIKGEPFLKKWLIFIEKTLNAGIPEEQELLNQIRSLLQKQNDAYQIRKLIEKNRVTLEL